MRDTFLVLLLKGDKDDVVRQSYYTISGPNDPCAVAGALWLLGRRPDVMSYQVVSKADLQRLRSQTEDAVLASAVQRYLKTFYSDPESVE